MELKVGRTKLYVDESSLEEVLSEKLKSEVKVSGWRKLGEGFHAVAYRIELKGEGSLKNVVLRVVRGDTGWGHDYVSDRAATLILQHRLYRSTPIPSRIASIDVLCLLPDGRVVSVGEAVEFLHVMEEVTEAEGRSYVEDLFEIASRGGLSSRDIRRCKALAEYLSRLHSYKTENRNLYIRHIRDLIGHGEMLMGVVDSYPDVESLKWTTEGELIELEKRMVEWRYRLKRFTHRTSRIHGDFHPFGNIRFRGEDEVVALEFSREAYGEPADDLSALTINYLFISLWKCGGYVKPFKELLERFFEYYLSETGDTEILKVIQPFYCFRGLVVAHPLYYPEMEDWKRRSILNFIHNVLSVDEFDPMKVGEYVEPQS